MRRQNQNRIKITTSGLTISRPRQLDFDHAVTIVEHLLRGYVVTVRGDRDGWKVIFIHYKPEGWTDATVYRSEAITPERPPWMAELKLYLRQHAPDMFPEEDPNADPTPDARSTAS